MPAPEVRVVDPGEPRGPVGDLLAAGPDEPPRRPPRALVVAGVVLALAVVGIVAGRAAQQDGPVPADPAPAGVSLGGDRAVVYGLEPGSGRIGAEVTVVGRAGREDRTSMTDVRLDGLGLTSHTAAAPSLRSLPLTTYVMATVDCERVRAGQVPTKADLVLTVVPSSGDARSQRLPAAPARVEAAVRSSCGLLTPPG